LQGFFFLNTSVNKVLGNENNTLFCKDRWLSECALQSQFPMLYDLASDKNATVSQIIHTIYPSLVLLMIFLEYNYIPYTHLCPIFH
jgi:hypothetical protein